MKKTVTCVIAVIILLSALICAALPVSAAYEFGEVYKTSEYYERLSAYELTGDARYDIVSIALTQVGYHEGDSDADMDGLNYSGSRNFVEYTRLYGKLDNGEGNGVSYGYAWCAAFVSWCMRQARVPESLVVTEVSCPRMIKFLSGLGTYKTRESGFIPRPGDMIFFKNAGSTATSTHIGIVVGVKDGEVYTVEGNADNNVTRRVYSMSDSYIVGYGAPDYTVKEGAVYDFPLYAAEPYPAGEYVVTADSLNRRDGPGTSYAINGVLSRGDRVTVTETDGGWGKTALGWISMSYAVRADLVNYRVTYSGADVSRLPAAQRKLTGQQLTLSDQIPVKQGYLFEGWATSPAGDPVYAPGSVYDADADLALYAVFTPTKVKMSFFDSDGTTLLFEREYDYGSDMRKDPPEDPVKAPSEGKIYTFVGWDPKLPGYVKWETSFTATWTESPAPETTAAETAPSAEPASGGCGSSSGSASLTATLIGALFAAFVRKKAEKEGTD